MKIFDFSALVFMLLFLSLKLQFCLLCFQNTVLFNVLGVMPAFLKVSSERFAFVHGLLG